MVSLCLSIGAHPDALELRSSSMGALEFDGNTESLAVKKPIQIITGWVGQCAFKIQN